jgi:hypothetical protein
MRNLILSLILSACSLLAVQDVYGQAYLEDYYIKRRVAQLVPYIPDHGMENSRREAFEPSFYRLLNHAFSMPSSGIGEIGYEEWLYYFVSGQDYDGSENNQVEVIDYTLNGQKTAYVEVKYFQRNHTIVLHYNGFDWVIADFDSLKTRLEQYIAEMREYFQSREWDDYVANIMNGDDEDWKQMAREKQKELEEYFRKYPLRK